MARRTDEPILKKGALVKINRYYKATVANAWGGKENTGIVLDIHNGKQVSLFPFYDIYVFNTKTIETIWGGDMDLISE
jgi:hypothetical protein|tara:strand:- start:273 stop:506 length:234 start_codon:yes stop_codon:yes gene_type:complete